jgi:hypothetical protein
VLQHLHDRAVGLGGDISDVRILRRLALRHPAVLGRHYDPDRASSVDSWSPLTLKGFGRCIAGRRSKRDSRGRATDPRSSKE